MSTMCTTAIPNVRLAKQSVFVCGSPFSAYCDAYLTANENVRLSMSYMPIKCENALIVAASGDQPLFSLLYGAKHVDTFDVTYNAKCIMDIKTAAIQRLNYAEYWKLLVGLYKYDVKLLDKIYDLLPDIEYDYLCSMNKMPLFRQGCNAIAKKEYTLNKAEYNKLQQIVNQHFNFIWTDIKSLKRHLYKMYDFMHFSNIFDYCDSDIQQRILFDLTDYINVGGKILLNNQKHSSYDVCENIVTKCGNWQHSAFSKKNQPMLQFGSINILTRIR